MNITRDMVIAMLGLSRLAMFDKSGADFFPASGESALRSFWAPALAAPLFLIALLQDMPPFMSEVSSGVIYSVVGLGMIISFCGYYLAVSTICNASDRTHLFARYVTINNWATVLYLVVLIPSLVVNGFGIGDEETRQIYDKACTLVLYVYMWFIARHSLNFGGLGAVGLVVLFNLIYFLAMVGASIILVQAAGGQEHVQMMLESMQNAGAAATDAAAGAAAGGGAN